jgi:hypothetical protein
MITLERSQSQLSAVEALVSAPPSRQQVERVQSAIMDELDLHGGFVMDPEHLALAAIAAFKRASE